MKNLNGAVLILLFFHLMAFSGKAEEIKMKISLENENRNFRLIEFSPESFETFYQCICNYKAQNCVAQYQYGRASLTVRNIITESSVTGNEMSLPFNLCRNDQSRVQVVCRKSNSTNDRKHIQSFRHRNILCERNCVSIIWSFPEEMIDFGNSTNYVETNESCFSNCDGTPSNCNKEQEDDDNNTTATVVGIVVTLLVVAVIAIIAFFLWRRRKQKSKPPEQHLHLSGITSSNTHDTGQDNRPRNNNVHLGTSQPSSSTIERDCSGVTGDNTYINEVNKSKDTTNNTPNTTDTVYAEPSQPFPSTIERDSSGVTDGYTYINEGKTLKGITNNTPKTIDTVSGYVEPSQPFASATEPDCSGVAGDFAYINEVNTSKDTTNNTPNAIDTASKYVEPSQPFPSTFERDFSVVTDGYAYINEGNTLNGTTNNTPLTIDPDSSGTEIYNESNVGETEDGYSSIDQPISSSPYVN